MVSDDFSCIKEVTKVVHLTLPSSFNSNEVSGICDALESWKRQYIQQLQGIVVSYKNVSLTSKCGFLKIDYPVIHCNVKATFELFYPSVGSIVKGKVNRISHDHIGCLVHDTVNVTVHRTSDISEEDSKCIALDRYILFQITRINFKRKIIHVKGKITEECINLMKKSGLFNQESEISESNRVTCISPQFAFLDRENNIHQNTVCSDVQNSVDETSSTVSSQFSSPSKKKKRKRDKEDELSSPSIFSQSLDSGINEIEPTQVPVTPSKKKHKSKTNHIPEEIKSVSSTDADSVLHIKDEVNTTESDISTSPTKSHKKKKHRISNDIPGFVSPSNNINSDLFSVGLTNSLSESDISSSSKKKKKKHKKSKEDTFDSPSTFNEPQKKHKKSKDGTFKSPSSFNEPEKKQEKSESGSVSEEDNSESLLKPNIIYPGSPNTHASPVKIKQESPANEDLLSSLLAQLRDADDAQDRKDVKKAKKRKHDSTDDAGLPKKKRKENEEKTKEKLEKDSKKEKKKKKGKKKGKSEKDSKKSKKSKTKVLSTKKKPFGSKIKSKKKSKDKKDKSKTEKKDKPTE